ncbi:MAG: A24 family peptidase C-terminal domain-containing protein [Candidatus Bathyarchaeaceae archaeon]
MNEIFDGARIFLCLAFMAYASWSDYRTREVSNLVWAFFAPLAFTLTSFQFLLFAPDSLYIYALSFIVTSALSIAIFYSGAFGGADAKALMCLALALPIYPAYLLQTPQNIVSPIFPIIVFTNAVVLAALTVVYAVLRNLLWMSRNKKGLFGGLEKESFGRKALTFLCGYKVKITQLETVEHMYPIEDVYTTETGESRRRLILFPKDEEREAIVERILEAADEGKIEDEVWATPGLPMLIFITVGLIVALTYGDIVWSMFRFALK